MIESDVLTKAKKWLSENRRDVAMVVVLFLVALLPRVWDLGTFLTADEKNWMGRSYEFVRAVKDWRFNDTLQTTHPGVTTLWMSGLSITAWMYLTHTPFSYQTLAHFAAAAQLPIALANSLAVPLVYLFLRKLLRSEWLSGFSALLIALNPLLIGYSRVAHVDALLASLMMLAALAMLIYAQSGYKRNWLITSAVLSGLAILTKAPAIFLIPFFILVLLVFGLFGWPQEKRLRIDWEHLRDRARDFTLWILLIVLMFLILWPAMLFVPNPKGNFLLVKRDLLIATETPHDMTEDYTLNSSHYPLTLLTRTVPITLMFSVIGIVFVTAFGVPSSLKLRGAGLSRSFLWLLVGYLFFFIVMMTLGAKKGDRYILPVFPVLDILAAFGISLVASWFGYWREKARYILSLLAVLYLVVVFCTYRQYAIAYSSPLFMDNLSQELGWGEGLDQVASWLNTNDPHAIVASWYPEELGAYTTAQVAHINAHEQAKVQYVILYRNMFGRSPDHYANNFIDEYYKKRKPVFVARIADKEFAWVYKKWAFPTVVGELLPGNVLEQKLPATHDNLSGVDVLVATYSGKARAGELVVSLNDFTWRIPVSKIENDRWLTLRLPSPVLLNGKDVTVKISAEGTVPGNAPTIRKSPERLGVRLRYKVGDNQEAHEEELRLLR